LLFLLHSVAYLLQVFNEKTPLDDDAKPSESMQGGPHDKLNWMKAGIMAADRVLTVSPNYASEISANAEKGVELDKYIR
jgi:granule-bound starch synthase